MVDDNSPSETILEDLATDRFSCVDLCVPPRLECYCDQTSVGNLLEDLHGIYFYFCISHLIDSRVIFV